MMDVYRKNAFSARPWRWYPDACFLRRRPSCFTHVIVRSRHATLPQAWMQPENWEFETHTLLHEYPLRVGRRGPHFS